MKSQKANKTVKNTTTTSSTVCLFCARRSTPWSEIAGGGGGEGFLVEMKGNEPKKPRGRQQQQSFTESGKDDDDGILQGTLRAIFVCRQVLRLSVDQVADYLSRNDGSLNPDGWFSLCASCDAAVKECYTLQRILRQLEGKWEGAKLRLLSLIYSTTTGAGAEHNNTGGGGGEECQDLSSDIRGAVLKDLKSTHQEETGGAATGTGVNKKKKMMMMMMSGTEEAPHHHRRRKRGRTNTTCPPPRAPKSGGIGGGISQNHHEQTAVAVGPISERPPEEHDDNGHGSSAMEFDSPVKSSRGRGSSSLRNLIVPPDSLDDVDDDDASAVKLLDSPSSSKNDKNEDSSGSDWSPSDGGDPGVPDSDDEDEEDKGSNDMERRSHDDGPAIPNPKHTDDNSGGDGPRPPRRSHLYAYRCDQCPATYSKKSRLAAHSKLHEEKDDGDGGGGGGGGVVTCTKCGWLVLKLSLEIHKSRFCRTAAAAATTITTGDPVDKLLPKKRKGKYRYRPKRHKEKEETEGIPYYCDHCHMIFTTKRWLVHHYENNHGGSELASCSQCPSNFVSKQLLAMHTQANHHNHADEKTTEEIKDGTTIITPPPPLPPPAEDDSEPKKCPHCSETTETTTTFPSKLELDFHIAKDHRAALLTCPTCGWKSRKYHAFVEHSRTHLDVREKLVACHLCDAQFTNKGSLDGHLKSNHWKELGLEEIGCTICGIHFTSKSALKIHTELVHEKKKEHFCEFCGKGFGTSTGLKNHLLLHTAPRELQYKKGPFPCQYCAAKFNVRQGLYYHLKKAHNDKYRFQCAACGKGYCSKAMLTHHQRRGECSKVKGPQ